ncbi:hypothetical protein MKZ38_008651 [Zalerion maritima]|uniref:Uncharacterized protein n=1 Tax=Zalerion maritima TaxID=339359 RepID=A0AAD5RGK5_9PEZI|nr:hypothetical protein MKZ38_008651 [Zalerion maritima]
MHKQSIISTMGLAATLLASTSSAYDCTFSSSVDLEDYVGSGDSSGSDSGSSSGSGGGYLNQYTCPDGTVTYFAAECLDVSFRRPRLQKRDMECSSDEICVSYQADLGCMNEDYDVRDEAGSTINLVTGDYELADGTTGNVADEDGTDSGSDDSSSGSSSSSSSDDESGATVVGSGCVVGISLLVAAAVGLA